MGMFDSLEVIIDASGVSPFRCAAGHNLYDFQTKDLACEMDTFKVIGSLLYGPSPRGDQPGHSYEIDGPNLVETSKRVYPPSLYTGQFCVYGHCPECDPIVYESPNSGIWNDGVGDKQIWCEFEAVFRNGLLVNVIATKLETREEIRKNQVGALPDDDRVAKKHIEQFRTRKGGW